MPRDDSTATREVEDSSGAVLVQAAGADYQALVIQVRTGVWELPKGHVEPGESAEHAALRELREETGLTSAVECGPEAGRVEYTFPSATGEARKRVVYFVVRAREAPVLGRLPARTRAVRWVSLEDVATLPLVSEALRPILLRALESAG